MISSHETQNDFERFYEDLINEAESLYVNYEPEMVMQDACPASKHALLNFFPQVKFLMCYFHVKKNVRDHKLVECIVYFSTEFYEFKTIPAIKKKTFKLAIACLLKMKRYIIVVMVVLVAIL